MRRRQAPIASALLLAGLTLVPTEGLCQPATGGASTSSGPVVYINTAIENGSPLYWETASSGVVHLYLVYDQERASPNRANGHWHFEVQARPGSTVTLVLHNFDNVWNGKSGSPVSERTITYVSEDQRNWTPLRTRLLENNQIELQLRVRTGSLFLARLEPYRLSDLARLLGRIRNHGLVELIPIGKTVEGRDLEMIRLGKKDAPRRVLLRARAHAWESGGNWVLEGLIERLLRQDPPARQYLGQYCVYILPVANKDGVARGRTRFNSQGRDLNRNWDRIADEKLAPENYALERWLQQMIARGQRPHLAIDFHNDESGRLHVGRPEGTDHEAYLRDMARFEALLRQHTWFTEGSTGASFRNPGTFGEGLLARYRIVAFVHELNANWIAGLNTFPSAKHWREYGAQLGEVFYRYFTEGARPPKR